MNSDENEVEEIVVNGGNFQPRKDCDECMRTHRVCIWHWIADGGTSD